MKKLFLALLLWLGIVAGAGAATEGGYAWDKFPAEKTTDIASLQNGAKLFVNYCLNCHSAAYMRYNRMRDIGLTEDQIKKNLLFATDKVGDTMRTSLNPRDAKDYFGAQPPDLSVITRSRADPARGSGADYVYTYLRTYYRDDTKATGWNNLAFPDVAMPNVLWELQGQRAARFVDEKDPHDATKTMRRFDGYDPLGQGRLSEIEFNDAVGDLVAYMQWMGEPAQDKRVRVGVWVLIFLAVFSFFAWRLSAAYWRTVK